MSEKIVQLFYFFLVAVMISMVSEANSQEFSKIFHDDFSNGMSDWHAEIENDNGKVYARNGRLCIEVAEGATVWLKKKLQAPVRIQYTIEVINKKGKNDRVSDMNCFWMAIDPRCPENIFNCTGDRSGRFSDYDMLQTYYVGYGGNNNSTTRFRRYTGTGGRPLLSEHDLRDADNLLIANMPYEVQLIADGISAKYFINDSLLFLYKDPNPITEGWFAFRTVNNHMCISDFKIYGINE